MVEVPGGSGYSFQYRHLAYVEYEEAAEAQKALKYMDGGQVDGQEVIVSIVKGINRGGVRRHKFNHDKRSRSRDRPARRSPPRKRRGSVGSSSDSD